MTTSNYSIVFTAEGNIDKSSVRRLETHAKEIVTALHTFFDASPKGHTIPLPKLCEQLGASNGSEFVELCEQVARSQGASQDATDGYLAIVMGPKGGVCVRADMPTKEDLSRSALDAAVAAGDMPRAQSILAKRQAAKANGKSA